VSGTLVAKAAVTAFDALTAQDEVPNNDPVIVGASNDPVRIIEPLTLIEPVKSNASALIEKVSADDAVKAFDAFCAYDALKAYEEDTADDALID
jgi:hypothetical protein